MYEWAGFQWDKMKEYKGEQQRMLTKRGDQRKMGLQSSTIRPNG